MYDGKKYAEIQIRAWKVFSWDGFFVAHSLGLEVEYTEFGAAPLAEGLLKSLKDVDKLELIDPARPGSMNGLRLRVS